MAEKKSILIKNKTVNINAMIYSLLLLLLSIIIPLIIGRILDLKEEEIVRLVPYGLCVGVIGIIFIFLKFRKINYLLEIKGNTLFLKNNRTKQIIDESLIKAAKIEYGYYNYRYRTLINRQVPLILFQFPNIKPFRCSITKTKPIILFWDGDDTQKNIYNVPINLEPPNYNMNPASFEQLAEMLIPKHKLVQLELKPMY